MKMQNPVIFLLTKNEYKHAKDKYYYKVRDHYHYAGEYRRTSQSICNLK